VENEELMDSKIEDQATLNSESMITATEEIIESPVSEAAIEAVVSNTASENRIDDTTEIKVDSRMEDAKWYVLHTFSGYENVAKENLEIVKDKYNLQERIFDIVIPMEDVVEEKNGKQKIVSRKVMPGYIFVKMIYGDDIWHAVTRTRGITGFTGPKGRPLPMTEDEIRRLRLERVVVDFELNVGETVEIVEGPFTGNAGVVESVDPSNKKCKLKVSIFGREVEAELSYEQIRKL